MSNGKYAKTEKVKSRSKKTRVLLASLALLLVLSVGGTIAYLMDSTGPVVNTFDPAEAKVTITEDFDGQTKKDIVIENESDFPAYIRATLAIYWIDGNGVIVKPTDCRISEITINSGWVKRGEIYYYTAPVAKNGTVALLEPGTAITAYISPEFSDYRLVVEVLAEAIQAEPKTAVETAWGVSVGTDGNLSFGS